MSDDNKPKPVEDLKEGLGLLFRAAKGAVEKASSSLPTDKVETVAKDAVKEVSRAFESLGNEIDKAFGKTGSQPPPKDGQPPVEAKKDGEEKKKDEEKKEDVKYDDGYAPEPPPPPKGPRIG